MEVTAPLMTTPVGNAGSLARNFRRFFFDNSNPSAGGCHCILFPAEDVRLELVEDGDAPEGECDGGRRTMGMAVDAPTPARVAEAALSMPMPGGEAASADGGGGGIVGATEPWSLGAGVVPPAFPVFHC